MKPQLEKANKLVNDFSARTGEIQARLMILAIDVEHGFDFERERQKLIAEIKNIKELVSCNFNDFNEAQSIYKAEITVLNGKYRSDEVLR